MSSTYHHHQDIPTIQLEWIEFTKIMLSVFFGTFSGIACKQTDRKNKQEEINKRNEITNWEPQAYQHDHHHHSNLLFPPPSPSSDHSISMLCSLWRHTSPSSPPSYKSQFPPKAKTTGYRGTSRFVCSYPRWTAAFAKLYLPIPQTRSYKPTFPKREGFTSSDFTISIISDGSTIKRWKRAYCDSHVSRQCQRSRVPSERPFRWSLQRPASELTRNIPWKEPRKPWATCLRWGR